MPYQHQEFISHSSAGCKSKISVPAWPVLVGTCYVAYRMLPHLCILIRWKRSIWWPLWLHLERHHPHDQTPHFQIPSHWGLDFNMKFWGSQTSVPNISLLGKKSWPQKVGLGVLLEEWPSWLWILKTHGGQALRDL